MPLPPNANPYFPGRNWNALLDELLAQQQTLQDVIDTQFPQDVRGDQYDYLNTQYFLACQLDADLMVLMESYRQAVASWDVEDVTYEMMARELNRTQDIVEQMESLVALARERSNA